MLSFGKQENEEAQEQASSEEAPAGEGSTRGQKLWAVLLVVDSFFVIVFGGTLAAKLYQHWQAPAPAAGRAVKRAEPPKAPEPAKAPTPAPTPAAKAPEPVKAAPAKTVAPARPSLLQEPPKAHQSPAPQQTNREAPPPAAQPSTTGKKKAVAVDFQLNAPSAKKVQLIGAFIVHGGRKDMVKSSDGLWTLRLYLTPNTYRYHFVVDGKKKLDPNSAEADNRNSIITVP